MVDTEYLLRIGLTSGQRRVEYPDSEEKIGILEPFQVIRHSRFGSLVTQRFQVAGKFVNGIERSRVVYEPMCKVRNSLGMSNVMSLDKVPK